MPVAEIQTGGNSFRKIRYVFRKIIIFLRKSFNLGSRIEILGSEGVYLHEERRTHPSRHLPGPKTHVKKKGRFLGLGGSGGFKIRIFLKNL